MNDEETKVLNPLQGATTQPVNEENGNAPQKKGTGFAARAAATAAGAALGTAAAYAAEKMYEAQVENDGEAQEEVTDEVVGTPEEEVVDTVEEPTKHTAQTAHHAAPQTEHVVVEHHIYTHEDPTQESAPNNEGRPTPTGYQGPENEVPQEEVHVVGVAVTDNGQGGMATLVGLQQGEDSAMVIDIDTDGTVDYYVHDDNQNGHIEDNEYHDVSDQGYDTADLVHAYIEEAHGQGAEAIVTNLDNGEHYQIVETNDGLELTTMEEQSYPAYVDSMDDNLYTAGNDDMPDYVNDADAGIMEA